MKMPAQQSAAVKKKVDQLTKTCKKGIKKDTENIITTTSKPMVHPYLEQLM